MTIYERIKQLREQQGMSQQTLAEKVGFKTASAVNKIELGLRDINQSKVIAFAKALNTTPSYLFGDLEQEHTDPQPTTFTVTDNDLKVALFNGDKEVTDEMWNEVKRYARYIQDRENREDG